MNEYLIAPLGDSNGTVTITDEEGAFSLMYNMYDIPVCTWIIALVIPENDNLIPNTQYITVACICFSYFKLPTILLELISHPLGKLHDMTFLTPY